MPAIAPKRSWYRLASRTTTRWFYVNRVLNAAAWTYVAATLQSVLTLIYLISRMNQSRD